MKSVAETAVSLPLITATSVILIMLFSIGCISNQGTFNNVDISGYVMTESDSTAISGALIMVKPPSDISTYSDSTGFYRYHRTYPTGQGDPLELQITVIDIDGAENGIFISMDTVVYEDETEENLNLFYEVDFFVEIVEDSTDNI